MKHIAQPPALGRNVSRDLKRPSFVQTEKRTHEAWARFTLKKPTASAVMHYMCAYMGEQNALVIPQSVLAQRLGVSMRTIASAIADLSANQWIQIVRIGKGRECAYIVNDRVAWDKPRDRLNLSLFTATVVADADDQDELEGPPLRKIPVLFPRERQLPTGPGEDPPSQPCIEGLEPDLPSLQAQLEARGQQRLIDPETGEIL